MTTIQLELSRDHLLHAVEQLETDELTDLIGELLTLRAKRYAPILTAEETTLLQKVNNWLLPEEQEKRARLQQKLADETISPIEHDVLVALNEKAEWLTTQRLETLSQLALLRQTTLPELIKQLGLETTING